MDGRIVELLRTMHPDINMDPGAISFVNEIIKFLKERTVRLIQKIPITYQGVKLAIRKFLKDDPDFYTFYVDVNGIKDINNLGQNLILDIKLFLDTCANIYFNSFVETILAEVLDKASEITLSKTTSGHYIMFRCDIITSL